MSLFKAREWWHTSCGNGEEFDCGCMCVANIDNDQNGYNKVVTGSLQGILRIYLPKERDYKAEDLLLEVELEQAILQLEAGRFSSSGGIQLAVLHPRKLTVYSIQSVGSSFLQHTKLFEHYLEHTAANMVYGSFGGIQGSDYICVQSYDGQLNFIEQETHAFSRFLPNFLVPGPLCYNDAADSFVTCNAAFELESYKYKVLAAASSEKATNKEGLPVTAGLHSGKRLQTDWKVILGESAIDIRSGKYSPALQAYQADIVVLCEHTLFIVNVTGQIIFQRRLEYHPACCTLYPCPQAKTQGGADNLLVCTFSKTLHVYRDNVLSWAAKMDQQPTAVRVAEFGGIRGMIAALADDGQLSVNYLGTDPLLNPVAMNEGRELDYESMDREQRQLAAMIRDQGSGMRVEPSDALTLKAKVPVFFDQRASDELDELSGVNQRGIQNRTLTVRLYVAWSAPSLLTEVLISIRPPAPVTVEETSFVIPQIVGGGDEPAIIDIPFNISNAHLPLTNTATFVASYTTESGEPRSSSIEVALPMCLFCQVVPPVKSADYKITVTTNRPPPQMVHIFDDMLSQAVSSVAAQIQSASGGANVLSFQYYSGQDASILVSKTGGRYRIQSDSFEAMWLVTNELCRRLTLYYTTAEAGGVMPPEGPFTIVYDDALPLEDFFAVVDSHFAARVAAAELAKELEQRATQFRSIEKRLLMRFKDKNPSPLNQLDLLMEETYHELMDLGAQLEERQQAVRQQAHRLAAAVQLILTIIKYRFNLDGAAESLLRSCLSPEIIDSNVIGWEEHSEAAITMLLRTVLARNAKEAAAAVTPLAAAKDTGRLKKHLGLVLERMAKGMELVRKGETEDSK